MYIPEKDKGTKMKDELATFNTDFPQIFTGLFKKESYFHSKWRIISV